MTKELGFIQPPKYSEPESLDAFHKRYNKSIRSLVKPTGITMSAAEAAIRYNEVMAHYELIYRAALSNIFNQSVANYICESLKSHLPNPPTSATAESEGV